MCLFVRQVPGSADSAIIPIIWLLYTDYVCTIYVYRDRLFSRIYSLLRDGAVSMPTNFTVSLRIYNIRTAPNCTRNALMCCETYTRVYGQTIYSQKKRTNKRLQMVEIERLNNAITQPYPPAIRHYNVTRRGIISWCICSCIRWACTERDCVIL